jgi:hypothetical protein
MALGMFTPSPHPLPQGRGHCCLPEEST